MAFCAAGSPRLFTTSGQMACMWMSGPQQFWFRAWVAAAIGVCALVVSSYTTTAVGFPPSVSARIELLTHTVKSGTELHGTLVIENSSASAVGLTDKCAPPWKMAIENGKHPAVVWTTDTPRVGRRVRVTWSNTWNCGRGFLTATADHADHPGDGHRRQQRRVGWSAVVSGTVRKLVLTCQTNTSFK